MMQMRFLPKTALLVCALVSLLLCSACETGSVSFTPAFGLISFSISDNGVSLNADVGVVTPLGEFSYQYPLTSKTVDDGSLLLDIRYIKQGVVTDSVYTIRTNTDEVSVTTNGRTVITISNHRVLIDATGGDVQTVEVRDTSSGSSGSSATPSPSTPTSRPYQITWNRSYDTLSYLYQDEQEQPSAGNHFIVVSITVTNGADQAQSFPLNPTFVLYSKGDRQSWAVARFMPANVTVEAQSSLTLEIVFVVPNDTCSYDFSVSAFGSSYGWNDACSM